MNMLRKRGVSAVLALALAFAGLTTLGASTASAVTIPQPTARMADQVAIVSDGGADAPNQAAYCLRVGITGTSAGSSGSSTSSNWVGSTGTAYAAHGYSNICPTNLDTSQQSALGFTPRALTAITPETPFNLGSMRHINGGITSLTYKWYKGNLVVRFNGLDLTFPWTMWETPTQTPCPNGATGACPDETRFTSLAGNQTFTIDGVPYTLVLLGFTNNGTNSTCAATPGGTYTNDFWTPESATTYGCLYASVKQVRTLKIQKVVAAPYGAPATYPASAFTASSDTVGSAWGSAFSLTPTGTGSAGQAVKTANLVTGQTINISETAPTDPGWAFTGLSCTDGGGNSTITGLTVSGAGLRFSGDYSAATGSLAPITCTYTNTYTPRATLTLVKQVTTAGQTGTLASAADWTLSATGSGSVAGQSVSGASGSAAVTAKSVIAGTYSLAEVGSNAATTAGYVQDGAWTCTAGTLSGTTLTLAAGQSATCTVRNKFAVGKLAITKTVTGAGYTGGTSKAFTAAYTCTSGTATVKSGTVTVHPGASNGTAGATATIDDVPAGATCAVTEANPPTGTSTDLVNPSWSWSAPINPAAVTIAADTTSTVNITNGTTRQLGSLQLTTAISPRAGVPGAGYTGGAVRTFPITYSCTLVGTVVSSGTVNVSPGTPVTVPGIPATSSCSVSSEDQAQKSGDFLDPSYAWDNYTAGAAVTIQNNGTATIGVTNYFRRDTVSLTIAKVVTGNGYSGTARDFTVTYDCGAPYTGTVTVAAGGSESVTVPAGVACTVSEKAPAAGLLKPGYVWGDATYAGLTGGTVTVSRPGPGTVTITNPTSIGYGRIQVRKAVDSFATQVASGTVFTLGVRCDAPAQGTADNFETSYQLTWPSTTTALTPYLPVGTSCTVTETDAPTGHDALPNASYDWKPKPEAVTVKVPAAEDPRIVTVTNDIARVYGQLTITKDVVNHTGLGTGGFHFSGTYRCDYNNGEDVKSGSWDVTGQGQATTVDVLVGSSCTVSEDNPGTPVSGDRSYSWSTQTPDPTTVGKSGATATVVNTLNRAEGSFNIAKSVEGRHSGHRLPRGSRLRFQLHLHPGHR